MTNEEYARHIAEQWNVKENGGGYVPHREPCPGERRLTAENIRALGELRPPSLEVTVVLAHRLPHRTPPVWSRRPCQPLVPTSAAVFDFPSLVAKLRHIETLFAGATTPGERDAADAARDRIQKRLADLAASSPPVERVYTLQNPWSKMLFMALARRYGLKPYRYRRQRHTTVMLRVSPRFCDETLWPEFVKLDRELMAQLDTLTQQVIAQAIHADTSDAIEREGQLALPGGGA